MTASYVPASAFVPGQAVMVRKTGSLGRVLTVRGSTLTVTVEGRYTFRFDRSELELVPSGRKAGTR